jgi:hypothetical protein
VYTSAAGKRARRLLRSHFLPSGLCNACVCWLGLVGLDKPSASVTCNREAIVKIPNKNTQTKATAVIKEGVKNKRQGNNYKTRRRFTSPFAIKFTPCLAFGTWPSTHHCIYTYSYFFVFLLKVCSNPFYPDLNVLYF